MAPPATAPLLLPDLLPPCDEVARALRAETEMEPEERIEGMTDVKIKPLDWRERGDTDGIPEWIAETDVGTYHISYAMASDCYVCGIVDVASELDGLRFGRHGLAMFAVDRVHQRRILACIETP